MARNRIKELRQVRAGDLRRNGKNFRRHPREQRDTLKAVLNEVGMAGAVIARELPDGSLELVDGHLRQSLDPEAVIPVLVTDLTDEEASKVLLSYDAISGMAELDDEHLEILLNSISLEDPALQALADDLAKDAGLLDLVKPEPVDADEVQIDEKFNVLVTGMNGVPLTEEQQGELLMQLTEQGYECRALTV
jgi:hypothetical protein